MSTALHRPSRRGRRTAGLATGLAVALTVAGCGDSSSGGGEAAAYEPASSDLSATITYGVWDQNQVPVIEQNIAAFNEEFPDVTVNVNVTPYSEYWTKLQTQGSSQTLPDLFWMNGPNFQLYAANDLLEPITEVVEAGDIDPANYPEALNELYTLDDVQYGVPKDFDTIGVWVNTQLFEQAGVELPSGDWTWEDFQATAAEISQKLSGQGVYGAAGGMDGQTTYYNTIFQSGGSVIDGDSSGYDTPETQQGIQFWTDLIASGGSPSMQQLTDTTADQWFVSGKLAMYFGGSWFRSAITDSDLVGTVTALPLPIGEEQATVIHGVSNVVAADSENKQAAQALQVFLAGEEAQRQLGEAGSVIPAYTGTQDAFADSLEGADLQVFLDALDYARPLPVSANTAEWNAAETELLPEAFSGARPVDEVTAELAERMNTALAAE
ncbi:sugar ABC transporter substrate-binding protein [uncultured Modestobacter sp.]|uniref:ABC transporter substrate-binding protein n=1 Tax=uncultured Modestobacter sp. TaxID=380048 RepID=UPI0026114315|nr:sugar ABC transporter substrate-binding protein [uncultured Modestobacter sp.]